MVGTFRFNHGKKFPKKYKCNSPFLAKKKCWCYSNPCTCKLTNSEVTKWFFFNWIQPKKGSSGNSQKWNRTWQSTFPASLAQLLRSFVTSYVFVTFFVTCYFRHICVIFFVTCFIFVIFVSFFVTCYFCHILLLYRQLCHALFWHLRHIFHILFFIVVTLYFRLYLVIVTFRCFVTVTEKICVLWSCFGNQCTQWKLF